MDHTHLHHELAVRRGLEAFRYFFFDEAVPLFQQYLEKMADDHFAWTILGNCEGCRGNLQAMAAAYSTALERGANPEEIAERWIRMLAVRELGSGTLGEEACVKKAKQKLPGHFSGAIQRAFTEQAYRLQEEWTAFWSGLEARKGYYRKKVFDPLQEKSWDAILILTPYLDFIQGYPPYGTTCVLAYLQAHQKEAALADLNLALYENAGAYKALWKPEEYDNWQDPFQLMAVIQPLFSRDMEFLARELAKIQTSVLGFTCFAVNRFFVRAMAKTIAREPQRPSVILGGADCFYPDQCAQAYGDLAGTIDAFVPGEGETPLLKLLDKMEAGKEWRETEGVLTLDADGKPQGYVQPPPLPSEELTAFPKLDPDYVARLPEPRKRLLATNRGCANHCDFCYDWKAWRKFRLRPVESILAEMAWFQEKHNLAHFNLVDSATNSSLKHLEALCDGLIAAKMEVTIDTSAMINPRMTPELFQKMKQAGFRELSFGLESGSSTVLKAMQKRGNAEDAGRLLKMAAQAGLYNRLFMILGHPAEGEKEFQETLDFLRRNFPWIHEIGMVNVMQIVPHTDLAAFACSLGIEIPQGWRTFSSWEYGENTILERARRQAALVQEAQKLGLPVSYPRCPPNSEKKRSLPRRLLGRLKERTERFLKKGKG